MEILLEELYKADIHLERFLDRKLFIDKGSYEICGITQSGKSKLVKSYLTSLRKRSYLYIDCADERIETEAFNSALGAFCRQHEIQTLVLDNYNPSIVTPVVPQLIVISQRPHLKKSLPTLWLYPLDYEEFLAFEHKYDSTALNHYLQLGGLPAMHRVVPEERVRFIQDRLRLALDENEFDILAFCAKHIATHLSPFSIYERLRQKRRISKDKTYASFKALLQKRYLHEVAKFEHPKAAKKLYVADIFFKTAFDVNKHFGRLFENLVFLELFKKGHTLYYADEIDFYLPQKDEIVLCKPFADERRLFQKLESIEAFIFSYNVKRITAVTMSKEGSLSHPLSQVQMLPFDVWALGD